MVRFQQRKKEEVHKARNDLHSSMVRFQPNAITGMQVDLAKFTFQYGEISALEDNRKIFEKCKFTFQYGEISAVRQATPEEREK